MSELLAFVRESNRIEGIKREPTTHELQATSAFLDIVAPSLDDLKVLVRIYQPDAVLRDKATLNVSVGDHVAPRGGPAVVEALEQILDRLLTADPWQTHVAYETLHPFTDGNGRSGRALWAWQMVRRQDGLPLGFLHQFYYQTLSRSRA